MARIAKKRAVANAKVDAEKVYSLEEAMALVKEVNTAKFDASVDLHVRLGIDPRKADQALRGSVSLPHGTGKSKRVAVFCTPDKEDLLRSQLYLFASQTLPFLSQAELNQVWKKIENSSFRRYITPLFFFPKGMNSVIKPESNKSSMVLS